MKKKHYQMLRKGLETIAREYANFLQELQKKSEELYDPRELHLLSMETEELLKGWLKDQLNKIQDIYEEENNESQYHKESLILLKEKYDKILHAGTCVALLGKSPKIVTRTVPAFELFSAYHSFLNAGLCKEITREDIESLLEDTEKFLNVDAKDLLNIQENKENESFRYLDNMKNEIKHFNEGNKEAKNKYSKFRQEVMNDIKKVITLIKATEEQKESILEKSEDVLDRHILRAKKNEIIIRKDANPLTNAAAIIYAVTISNQSMPKISGVKMSKIIGAYNKAVSKLYNNWYKDLARKINFDFRSVKLGRSRKIISLYLFKLFIGADNDISELTLRLKKIYTLGFVSRLREVFTSKEEHDILKQLTEEEIETYQDMACNYPDTFTKFFSDLIHIIKLLIISNKSHMIIGADFSILHFVRFLMERGINLCLIENGLVKVISDIFKFLRKNHFDHFPAPIKSAENSMSGDERIDTERREVVGNRIKLYVMKHIYKGKYFDITNGVAICPDCLNEGFIVNTSSPRIRSKEFHHEDKRIEGYEARDLYELYISDRGNPYFLQDLIKKMEDESVVLKCGSHHSIINAIHFHYFRKLISWENVPNEFLYKDIFDLPAEVINILVMICVDNFNFPVTLDTKLRSKEPNINELSEFYSVYGIRGQIIYFLKKRYIIDQIYGGICPACGEFNTKEHLPAFEFNHLYELRKLMPKEREKFRKRKVPDLYFFPCSKLVKELEKERGGFVCRNCHFVIHEDISRVDKIYDDQNIIREVLIDHKNTIKKYKQNLIYIKDSIKNPLTAENEKYRALMDYLFALFEISKEKGVVTSIDLMNKMGRDSSNISRFFRGRKDILEKYGRIVVGKPTKYYMNDEGKRIVRLMYYFRDYYSNLSS